MIAADFHMHTDFSGDSETAPEDMVLGAIAKGLRTICFTDHHDKEIFIDGTEEVLDIPQYFETMQMLRDKYQAKIDIRIGIEIGLQPHLGGYYDELCRNWAFDFVIGSTHSIRGKDLYCNRPFFRQYGDEEAYRLIFLEMLEDIKATDAPDVLGHMDYMVRYGIHQVRDYSYQKFAGEIDEILRYLIEQGKGIELNMSGFKYNLGFCHPHPDIIKRYRELGGEIIVVGADGHQPEHIAYKYHRAEEILKECGFAYYTEFKERKPIFKSL